MNNGTIAKLEENKVLIWYLYKKLAKISVIVGEWDNEEDSSVLIGKLQSILTLKDKP